MLEQSYQLWQSYLLVQNGEKEQFGDLLDHLQKQFALGTDQFPKNVMKAADVMGAHEAQKGREKNKRQKSENTNEKYDDKQKEKDPKQQKSECWTF